MTTLYPPSRSSACIFYFYSLSLYIVTKKKTKKNKKKMTHGLPWVKISKVMPQPNSPFPPGKGGKPHGKKSKFFSQNMVRPNRTHLFLHL